MSVTGGIVLCGGRSSRMGRPKAWLPVGDETMLRRAVRVVYDEVEGRGPLGGLSAGLAALKGECDRAYLSACDVPLLRAGFVRTVAALVSASRLTVPLIAGRLHPLAAVYSMEVLPVVLAQLAAGDYRMTRLPELVPTRYLSEADFADVDPQLVSLQNVNTWAEYEEIRAATDGHG
jgi:molybdenum cofactor guanylyltransferase